MSEKPHLLSFKIKFPKIQGVEAYQEWKTDILLNLGLKWIWLMLTWIWVGHGDAKVCTEPVSELRHKLLLAQVLTEILACSRHSSAPASWDLAYRNCSSVTELSWGGFTHPSFIHTHSIFLPTLQDKVFLDTQELSPHLKLIGWSTGSGKGWHD